MHPFFTSLNYMGQLEKKLRDDVYGDYKFSLTKEIEGLIVKTRQAINIETDSEKLVQHTAMLKAYNASIEVIDMVWSRFNS
jgi:hypothetical protein